MRGMFIVVALSLLACQRAEAPRSAAADSADAARARDDIVTWVQNFERWLPAAQVDSLATLVTDDYQALAPNQPAIAGKASFIDFMRQSFALGRWTERFIPEPPEVNGALAVQRGRYTLSFEPGTSAPRGTTALSDTGKFLWHWRNVDGRWLLAAAAWNSDLPAKP